MKDKQGIGGWAFLPIIVFLALFVGCGLAFTLSGAESPFSYLPRQVALLGGTAVALMLAPKISIKEKLDVYCQSMGNPGVMIIVLIYLMAGGFQGAALCARPCRDPERSQRRAGFVYRDRADRCDRHRTRNRQHF